MPPVVKNLLIINIIFFVAQTFLPIGEEITNMLGLHYWISEDFHLYQFITYMFLHGGMSHLFFNMFALWMFGRILEAEIGSKRFLIFYVVTGIGAALFNMGVMELEFSAIREFLANPSPDGFLSLTSNNLRNINMDVVMPFVNEWQMQPSSNDYISEAVRIVRMATDSVTIGASGSVFGILLAFGLMHPNDRIMLLIPPIPMKAKYFVMGYAAIELGLGFSNNPGDSIAHFAHIGGMLWAWLLLSYWKKKRYIWY